MPITTLDPRTALVVIDLQRGITGRPLAHPIAGVLANARALADAFAARSLPVVLVTVEGAPSGRSDRSAGAGGPLILPEGFADLDPALGVRPDDLFVVKHTPGAFTGTELDAILKSTGVTQLVVIGVATGSGVEATVRHAFELGYNIVVPLDAVTDADAEVHTHVVAKTFPKMAETGSTADVLALLETSHE